MVTDPDAPCCSASRSSHSDRDEQQHDHEHEPHIESDSEPTDADTKRMVEIPGGEFQMGTDSDIGFPADGEGPARDVTVDAFYIDQYAVTNAEFFAFVKETGHTTTAEQYGWSFVFTDFVAREDQQYVMQSVPAAPWWVAVQGANWVRPEGPQSSIKNRLDHPVTHLSWTDTVAYVDWVGKRLPTEAEWEKAARGGLKGKRYAWGDELTPNDEHRCNIWQGEFPNRNTEQDGYASTAPVDEYRPNGRGLYNVSGNVWEWCADWFSPDYHIDGPQDNPTGPSNGDERVMRGGSYLCHRSYYNCYRVAARSQNTPDSSTGNIGFRCALDAADL